MALTMGEKLRILINREKFTISELAKLTGTTNQNLSNKLTRDNFSEKEFQQIVEALGCKFEGFFTFENGDRI